MLNYGYYIGDLRVLRLLNENLIQFYYEIRLANSQHISLYVINMKDMFHQSATSIDAIAWQV